MDFTILQITDYKTANSINELITIVHFLTLSILISLI
jgi:hypothetical protein